MTAFATDIDEFRAVGHGMISLFNMAVLLAILAVLLSAKSSTPGVISQALGFVTWLVEQITAPISGGRVVNLSTSLAPAASVGSTAASSSPASAPIGTDNTPTMRITP